LSGNLELPRLTVYRSLRHISAQIIDDQTGKTIASATDLDLKKTSTKVESAKSVGAKIAEMAISKQVKSVRFDRGSYKYHGRVAALADGARGQGLQF
jgi:large subunit ribosomal protein L18